LISLHAIEGHKQRPLVDDMMREGRSEVGKAFWAVQSIENLSIKAKPVGELPCARAGSELH